MSEELTKAESADVLRQAANFISGHFEHDPMPPAIETLARQLNAMCAASPSHASDAELPPLPDGCFHTLNGQYFSADQMRAYGKECARAALASTRTASDTRTAALEDAAKACERIANHNSDREGRTELVWECAAAIRALAAGEAECDAALRAAPASQHDAWVSVKDRLPKVGELVLVYSPPTQYDHPGEVNIGFDCIDPNADEPTSWLNHNEHYEHFCCVAKPEGTVGPSAEAPYTHWMPLPPTPEQSAASRCGAQGRITQPVSVESTRPAEIDVEAERKLYLKAFPSFLGHGWTSRQEDEFKVWLAARTQADAGKADDEARKDTR